MRIDKSNKNNRSGQVLLEAIVALTILSMATLGIFGILSSSIGSSRVATDQDIAVGLAAEGIEVIKQLMNREIVSPTGGFGSPGLTNCGISTPCKVQYDDTAVSTVGVSAKLQIDANGFYNYDTGTESPFVRTITITSLDGLSDSTSPVDGNQLKVVSKVSWLGRDAIQFNVELEDRFFNW